VDHAADGDPQHHRNKDIGRHPTRLHRGTAPC
jgi:hypothetical protein